MQKQIKTMEFSHKRKVLPGEYREKEFEDAVYANRAELKKERNTKDVRYQEFQEVTFDCRKKAVEGHFLFCFMQSEPIRCRSVRRNEVLLYM